jgi:hypothetical protein
MKPTIETPDATTEGTPRSLLPPALLLLPLEQLHLPTEHSAVLEGQQMLTLGDVLLKSPEQLAAGGLPDDCIASLRATVARVLHDGLAQFSSVENTRDWPTLRVQLLAPLDNDERQILASLVGLEAPPVKQPELARRRTSRSRRSRRRSGRCACACTTARRR